MATDNIESLQKEITFLKQQSSSIQQENESLKRTNASLQQNYNKLIEQKSSATQNQHSKTFWEGITLNLKYDSDAVKSLIRDDAINMFDVTQDNETLLILAAGRGNYEITQLCVNLGADIDHVDIHNRTALYYARAGAWYHVEQLLLFSSMHASVGNRIKDTAYIINKQKGITQNILNQLNLYETSNKTMFKHTLMDLMMNIISKRLAFSDELLNVCWQLILEDDTDPLASNLWIMLKKTCLDIVENGSKRDWFWFKTFIIPSAIWFKQVEIKDDNSNNNQTYLYFELLQIVDIEAIKGLNQLEKDLNVLCNQRKEDWDKLSKWEIESEYRTARQDTIPNGIVSKYSHSQLSETTATSAQFNTHRFYDHNQYLSQLVLSAHIVDDEFQKSVQNVFGIDKTTNIANLKEILHHNNDDDEKNTFNGDGIVQYMRGPVKFISRARSKAENDYSQEQFPTTACVLDLNRCSLIFNDVATLLYALDLLINKVQYYQSGSIIGIVRGKNGFVSYLKQVQYADIKLNVLIKGKSNNIVGEIQMILRPMLNFKNKAHNLYGIQRQKEYINNCVSTILPMLLDEDKQLFVAGNNGDVRALCRLMTINNKTEKDIMKVDKESGESILLNIVSLNKIKAFKFLRSAIHDELFLDRLFLLNRYNSRAVASAIKSGRLLLTQEILNIPQVKQRYLSNDNELYRMFYWLFAFCPDIHCVRFVMGELQLTNDKLCILLFYKYHQNMDNFGDGAYNFSQWSVTGYLAWVKDLEKLKRLREAVGVDAFRKSLFIGNAWNMNALETIIWRKNMDMMIYVLGIEGITEYIKTDMEILFRVIWWMNHKFDDQLFRYVFKELNVTESKLKAIQSYQCPAADKSIFGDNAWEYSHRIVTDNHIENILAIAKK